MVRRDCAAWWVMWPALLILGCDPGSLEESNEPGGAGGPVGALHASLTWSGSLDDVTGVLFQISCEDGTVVSQYVPLETEPLPSWLMPGGGGQHAFADLYQVLPAGQCLVTAIPMQSPSTPSEVCEAASQQVTVQPGITVEIVLVMQCRGPDSGGLDIVGGLNHPPIITDLTYQPSKFIGLCEPVVISVGAVDPDQDPLTYTWSLISGPGSPMTFIPNGPSLTFATQIPGEYTIVVVVTDPFGGQTSLTFPIHVSDHPSVNQCNDCCKLEGPVFAWLSEDACLEQGGEVAPAEYCRQVCCEGKRVSFSVLSLDECQALGGWAVADVLCEPTCCRNENEFSEVPLGLCEAYEHIGATPADPEECAEVCCLDEVNGVVVVLPLGECKHLGWQPLELEACQEVCCLNPEANTVALSPLGQCTHFGGQVIEMDGCKEVCCGSEEGIRTRLWHDCVQAHGTIVADEECIETSTWVGGYTMQPGEPCNTPLLVVPSSGADALAVFDLSTLQPLPGSPFPTCRDPSRILMDPNTDVIATCRGDGKVQKHRKDGTLLWVRPLPGCNASRGIVLAPGGRLFAGCSNLNQVFELRPSDGEVLGFVDAFPGHKDSRQVYGLAADADGVYAVDGSQHVSRIALGAGPQDLQVLWTAHVANYGLAVDGHGHLWVTGDRLRALDTDSGAVVAEYPFLDPTDKGCGVMVGLDGKVWVGFGDANRVAMLDSLAPNPTMTNYHLPTGALHPRGVTVDAAGNAYTINLNSHNLTRIDPLGGMTIFGDGGVLNVPYGYSGDMTGLVHGCLVNQTEWWYGPVIDAGQMVQWLSLSWGATTPPGTGIEVFWSLDGGMIWNQAGNGQPIGAMGQSMHIRVLLSTTNGNLPSLDWISATWRI